MLDVVQTKFNQLIQHVQEEVCQNLKDIDENLEIQEDCWDRKDHLGEDGGGGVTRSLTGHHIESAGVNRSTIYGVMSPEFSKKWGRKEENPTIWASGISMIIHPRSPRVPTFHANYRMICLGQENPKVWFGGGADLTPFYPQEEDFSYFHSVWKKPVLMKNGIVK